MQAEFYTVVKGGHDHHGAELTSLDMEAVEAFVSKVKDRVSAFSVSSYFSIRNPAHELAIKTRIQKLTGFPVVCGHELSLDLGAYERGITAYLNAQLIPIASQFILPSGKRSSAGEWMPDCSCLNATALWWALTKPWKNP